MKTLLLESSYFVATIKLSQLFEAQLDNLDLKFRGQFISTQRGPKPEEVTRKPSYYFRANNKNNKETAKVESTLFYLAKSAPGAVV